MPPGSGNREAKRSSGKTAKIRQTALRREKPNQQEHNNTQAKLNPRVHRQWSLLTQKLLGGRLAGGRRKFDNFFSEHRPQIYAVGPHKDEYENLDCQCIEAEQICKAVDAACLFDASEEYDNDGHK